MMNIADISEDSLRMRCPEVLKILLQDRTTGTNIFWATNDYRKSGPRYGYSSPILPELITGKNATVIRPRVLKAREEQSARPARKLNNTRTNTIPNTQSLTITQFGRPSGLPCPVAANGVQDKLQAVGLRAKKRKTNSRAIHAGTGRTTSRVNKP